MSETTTKKASKSELLIRGAYTVLFLVIGSLVVTFVTIIAVFQFLYSLFAGASNTRLHTLSRALACYCHQIASYVLFVVEDKPYPFQDWPAGGQAEKAVSDSSSQTG